MTVFSQGCVKIKIARCYTHGQHVYTLHSPACQELQEETMSTAAPQVYGADEINAVVLDPGSYRTTAGYAGYDQPSIILPSFYGDDGKGKQIFDENVLFAKPSDGLDIKPIIHNNLIVDWDGAMEQFHYIFKELEVHPHEQPLMLTESTMNSYSNKVKMMEYVFEKENFCAFYAIKQPTCVSFAHGRPNCLVVDIGHDLVTVTPVIDGLCLRNQVRGTRYAGSFLNQQLVQFLESRNIEYVPQFQVKNKELSYWENSSSLAKFTSINNNNNVKQSVIDFHYLRTLREMKELLFECSMDEEVKVPEDITKEIDQDSTRWFELPNGLNVPFTEYERLRLSNSLFNPKDTFQPIVKGWENDCDGNIIKVVGTENDISSKDYVPLRRSKKNEEDDSANAEGDAANHSNSNSTNNTNSKKSNDSEASKSTQTTTTAENNGTAALGLTKLVQSVLNNLDIDLKPQLANNIILTGSTTLIPRLNERLNNDLMLLNPSLKIRVHSAGNNIERKYASWIGGSILSSLGTFHQLWVSKAEYEEVGAEHLIVNRFR